MKIFMRVPFCAAMAMSAKHVGRPIRAGQGDRRRQVGKPENAPKNTARTGAFSRPATYD
jgi:hypothetical protein